MSEIKLTTNTIRNFAGGYYPKAKMLYNPETGLLEQMAENFSNEIFDAIAENKGVKNVTSLLNEALKAVKISVKEIKDTVYLSSFIKTIMFAFLANKDKNAVYEKLRNQCNTIEYYTLDGKKSWRKTPDLISELNDVDLAKLIRIYWKAFGVQNEYELLEAGGNGDMVFYCNSKIRGLTRDSFDDWAKTRKTKENLAEYKIAFEAIDEVLENTNRKEKIEEILSAAQAEYRKNNPYNDPDKDERGMATEEGHFRNYDGMPDFWENIKKHYTQDMRKFCVEFDAKTMAKRIAKQLYELRVKNPCSSMDDEERFHSRSSKHYPYTLLDQDHDLGNLIVGKSYEEMIELLRQLAYAEPDLEKGWTKAACELAYYFVTMMNRIKDANFKFDHQPIEEKDAVRYYSAFINDDNCGDMIASNREKFRNSLKANEIIAFMSDEEAKSFTF